MIYTGLFILGLFFGLAGGFMLGFLFARLCGPPPWFAKLARCKLGEVVSVNINISRDTIDSQPQGVGEGPPDGQYPTSTDESFRYN